MFSQRLASGGGHVAARAWNRPSAFGEILRDDRGALVARRWRWIEAVGAGVVRMRHVYI